MNTTMKNVELFEAGTQTNSNGDTKEWTEAELQTLADNFNSLNPDTVDAAPAVIAHPEEGTYPSDTAPAWGWLHNVRVVGKKLVGDFRDVAVEFYDWVKEKRYSNRSISIDTENMIIKHVGWLGAIPPAVKTLASVKFKLSDKSTVWKFAGENPIVPEPTAPTPVSVNKTARSTQYGISALVGKGYEEKPQRFADLTDDDFGDPVNYRFPLSEELIDVTMRTFGKDYVQEQYSETDRQKIMARILNAMVKNGFTIPSYCLYKEVPGGTEFRFGESKHLHVPAELLTRQQLLKVVNATPPAPTPAPPQTNVPTNSPIIPKQEFAQMITEQQVLDEITKMTDAISQGQTPEIATAVLAEAQKLVDSIKALFAANAATPPADGSTPPANASEPQAQFSETEKRLLAKVEALEKNARRSEFEKFCEKAHAEGKLMPYQIPQVIDLLEATRAAGTHTFTEGNRTVNKAIGAAFQEFVNSLNQFDFKQSATKDNVDTTTSTADTPNGKKIAQYIADNSKNGKTITYRDAYYALVQKGEIQ